MSKEKSLRKTRRRIILSVILIFVIIFVILSITTEIGLRSIMKREKEYLGSYIVAEDRELGRSLADLGSFLYSSEWEVSEEQWETLMNKMTEDGWYQIIEGDERVFIRVTDTSYLFIPYVCDEEIRMSIKKRITDRNTQDMIVLRVSIHIETKHRRSRHK